VITNMGAGMADEQISHEQTKAIAPMGAAKLERVLRRYLQQM
jgi:purine-nucleoside phosphorylase